MQKIVLALTIRDRLALKDVLPVEAAYLEYLLIKSIQQMAEITAEDIHNYGIKQMDGGIAWDMAKDLPVEFQFTSEQFEILLQSAKRMDQEKKVNDNNVGLIQKIFAFSSHS